VDLGISTPNFMTQSRVRSYRLFPKFHSLIESVLGDSARFTNNFGSESRVPLGKLPKINFPEFDGENPKL
jgi:hypothetical protein